MSTPTHDSQSGSLPGFLKSLPIFSHLDAQALQALAAELELVRRPGGETLFAQGEAGETFYIVTAGRLRVRVQSAGDPAPYIRELGAGESVGEMALLTGQPRSATVTVLEDCELWSLSRSAAERLAQTFPDLLHGLAKQLLPRFQRDQTRIILKRAFGNLDDALLRDLLGRLDCRHLDSGEELFHQGDVGDEMFIIIQGRLRLTVDAPDGSQRSLGEAGAGESVGEFVLLAERGAPESRRAATVMATRSTDMIVITREVFDNVLQEYPQALIALTRQIARRSVSIGRARPGVDTNLVISVLPVHAGLGLEEFTRSLAAALAPLGSTMLLSAQGFERLYGREGAAMTPLDHPLSLVINYWLDEREREHAYSVYETAPLLDGDGRLTPWAGRCAEDADILLLVAEAGADPGLGAVEQALRGLRTQARVELVLLHPADCAAPKGTARWLSPRSEGTRPLSAHHHLRLGDQSDFRRLARRLTGRSSGLVLAGGGARGWAHLGVLRALEEANIEFDWVAGASMGAIVAAGCALGWSSARLRELAVKFSNPKQLLDYTFPYSAITSTRRITRLLQELYSEDIEDTWRPFFCNSADLTNERERLHTRGPLWKAVRASMAFPGIFAPLLEDGCVLIDGGAANNLPLEPMRAVCPGGMVIGVDLLTGSPVRGPYNFGPSLSGWQALLARLPFLPHKLKAPTLLDIIAGVVDGNNHYRVNESKHLADLLIRVPVEQFGLLEFDRYDQVIEAGYRAAWEELEAGGLVIRNS